MPDIDTIVTDEPVATEAPAPKEVTLEDAMRSYRRIAFLQQQLAVEEAYVASEKAKLDDWLKPKRETANSKIAWHQQILFSFYTLWHRRNPKDKSYKLPGNGIVGERANADTIVQVADDAALIATLEAKGVLAHIPDLVKRDPVLQWGELKKRLFPVTDAEGKPLCNTDGTPFIAVKLPDGGSEVIEGVTVKAGDTKLYLKLGTGLAEMPPAETVADDEPEGEG